MPAASARRRLVWFSPDGVRVLLPTPIYRAESDDTDGPGFRLIGAAASRAVPTFFSDGEYAGWRGALQAATDGFAVIAPTLHLAAAMLPQRRERSGKRLALGITGLAIGWQGDLRCNGRRTARVRVTWHTLNRAFSLGLPEDLTHALLTQQLHRAAGLRLLCEEVSWAGGAAHIPRFTARQYDELTIRYRREISRRLRVPRVKELHRYLETLP
jgi:hypothetical protein